MFLFVENTEFISNQWTDQVEQKKEAVRLLESEDSEYARYLAAERQKAEDMDLELKQLKLNREIELKEILKQQMIELKQREAESEVLNREEADLEYDRQRVKQLDERRRQLSEQNARLEYGSYLLRQHKAKLRQRAKETQDALVLDLQILQHIADTQVSYLLFRYFHIFKYFRGQKLFKNEFFKDICDLGGF